MIMTRRLFMPSDIHPYEERITHLWKYAREIEGSGMTLAQAKAALVDAGQRPAMVVRDWFIVYDPSREQRPQSKPFQLHFGEILGRNNEPVLMEELMMSSTDMITFINNKVFVSEFCTYFLVSQGGVIEDLGQAMYDYLNP